MYSRGKIGRFPICQQIGFGSSSRVFAVEDPQTKHIYAVKSLLPQNDSSLILKEIEVMINKNLRSPFLLGYYNYFSENETTHLFCEYCENGDLENFMKKRTGDLTEEECLSIFGQIVMGLSVLHQANVIHRDIKPQNLLLNNKNEIKIADFGISKDFKGTVATSTTTVLGTSGFIPADVLEGKSQSKSSDIFALGVTMFYVVTKKLPFEAPNNAAMVLKVVMGKYTPIERVDISDGLKDVIYRMIDRDPAKRPTIEELLTHPVLRDAITSLPLRSQVPPPPVLYVDADADGGSVTNRSTHSHRHARTDRDKDSGASTRRSRHTDAGAGAEADANTNTVVTGTGRSTDGSAEADDSDFSSSCSSCSSCSSAPVCFCCCCSAPIEESDSTVACACTHGHTCCRRCLENAAKGMLRAKSSGGEVSCLKRGCGGVYAVSVLEEHLIPPIFKKLCRTFQKNGDLSLTSSSSSSSLFSTNSTISSSSSQHSHLSLSSLSTHNSQSGRSSMSPCPPPLPYSPAAASSPAGSSPSGFVTVQRGQEEGKREGEKKERDRREGVRKGEGEEVKSRSQTYLADGVGDVDSGGDGGGPGGFGHGGEHRHRHEHQYGRGHWHGHGHWHRHMWGGEGGGGEGGEGNGGGGGEEGGFLFGFRGRGGRGGHWDPRFFPPHHPHPPPPPSDKEPSPPPGFLPPGFPPHRFFFPPHHGIPPPPHGSSHPPFPPGSVTAPHSNPPPPQPPQSGGGFQKRRRGHWGSDSKKK